MSPVIKMAKSADPYEEEAEKYADKPEVFIDGLSDFLSIQAWSDRPLPAAEPLLGHLITKTTRTFFVGSTGLGKTLVGLALAEGMSSGQGFLHWRSCRPAKVLYIDGEMASELIKLRSADALRRAAAQAAPGMLAIYARDYEEQTAAAYPNLGRISPLNTEEGQSFIYRLIAAVGGVDVVIFDNVMSLISGDQKDEVPWSETLPLVSRLSEMCIGQVWFDHTGHNTGRQYGSSTKAWRFDTVGIMTPLPDDQRNPREVAFQISFETPGKARRRTPENWSDFETCTIKLAEDQWTSNLSPSGNTLSGKRLTPAAQAFYAALLDALCKSSVPGQTTREDWMAEAVRLGLIAKAEPSDTHAARERKRLPFRKNMSSLKIAGWIGVDDQVVRSLLK